jgi:hypothetical protein
MRPGRLKSANENAVRCATSCDPPGRTVSHFRRHGCRGCATVSGANHSLTILAQARRCRPVGTTGGCFLLLDLGAGADQPPALFVVCGTRKKRPERSAFEGSGPWGQIEPVSTMNARAAGQFHPGHKKSAPEIGGRSDGSARGAQRAGVTVKAQHAGTVPLQTISRLKPRGQIA